MYFEVIGSPHEFFSSHFSTGYFDWGEILLVEEQVGVECWVAEFSFPHHSFQGYNTAYYTKFFFQLWLASDTSITLEVSVNIPTRLWQLKYFLCSPRNLGKNSHICWKIPMSTSIFFKTGWIQPPTRRPGWIGAKQFVLVWEMVPQMHSSTSNWASAAPRLQFWQRSSWPWVVAVYTLEVQDS